MVSTPPLEDEWQPVRVLPDLTLEAALEGDGIALAPICDARVVALRGRYSAFDQFLARFSDAFGVPLAPASMIVSPEIAASPGFTIDAVSGFRDAALVCVVPYAHASLLVYETQGRANWSDYFAIYPWMIDKDYEDLVVYTPAVHGVHEVGKFTGQGLATISRQQISTAQIDQTLWRALARRWRQFHIDRDDTWENRALFRSLNMANSAMLVQSGSETTQYDIGRSLALWGAAFEILAHEGPAGTSGTQQVVALFETLAWKSAKAGAKAHVSGRKKDTALYSLGAWLYFRLNDARNAFLHGNPIAADVFATPKGKHLWTYAAPLYRLALTSFLKLQFAGELPAGANAEAIAAFIFDRLDFEEVQGLCERALLTAIESKPERIRRAQMAPLVDDDEA